MDLKVYFDRAKADSDEVTRLQNEVDTLFNNGTDEGIQSAIDLQPALEAAIKKANESNKLYLSMRDAANTSGNAAALFVSTPEQPEEPEKDKVVNRAAFFAMQPAAREAFLKSGGKVTE